MLHHDGQFYFSYCPLPSLLRDGTHYTGDDEGQDEMRSELKRLDAFFLAKMGKGYWPSLTDAISASSTDCKIRRRNQNPAFERMEFHHFMLPYCDLFSEKCGGVWSDIWRTAKAMGTSRVMPQHLVPVGETIDDHCARLDNFDAEACYQKLRDIPTGRTVDMQNKNKIRETLDLTDPEEIFPHVPQETLANMLAQGDMESWSLVAISAWARHLEDSWMLCCWETPSGAKKWRWEFAGFLFEMPWLRVTLLDQLWLCPTKQTFTPLEAQYYPGDGCRFKRPDEKTWGALKEEESYMRDFSRFVAASKAKVQYLIQFISPLLMSGEWERIQQEHGKCQRAFA